MHILAVNCGSSSVKTCVFAVDAGGASKIAEGEVARIGEHATIAVSSRSTSARREKLSLVDWGMAVFALLDRIPEVAQVDAVGHRVVHGGAHVSPALIDEFVIGEIASAQRFAPLHNGPSLAGIKAIRERFRGVPMVAVFDTAFHAAMPAVAAEYAVPAAISADLGMRRYGYHGIAHRSMSERYADLLGVPRDGVSVITLQLGNGCSAAAVRGRRSLDTSMGFTPLEGLVMGTRSGDIDPAAVTYLLRDQGMTPDKVDAILNHESGLLGVSGSSGDMATLLEREHGGDPRAREAIELFCYRARKYIGAYLAVLGSTQAVIFGGGIGEHAPAVRRRICEPLTSLGIELDVAANDALQAGEGCFSTRTSAISAYVIPSDEERIIARDTYDLLTA